MAALHTQENIVDHVENVSETDAVTFIELVRRVIKEVRSGESIQPKARLRNAAAFGLATHALQRAKRDRHASRHLYGRERDFGSSCRRATKILFGEARPAHVAAVMRTRQEDLLPRTVWRQISEMGLIRFAAGGVASQAWGISQADQRKIAGYLVDVASRTLVLGTASSPTTPGTSHFALGLLVRGTMDQFELHMVTDDSARIYTALKAARVA